MVKSTPYDIFVIGGGINGCGIARDATGRGYSVCLAEMNDFASGTSSGSTKLIHGGLRYLEYYEFRLVREALMEREILWKMAPHIIWPLRFVLPHHKGLRPAWLLRLGLFIYDNLGGRKLLPATRTVNMKSDDVGKPLKPLFSRGFEYSDAWVDDARLVILNARDAANRGANIMARTKVVSAKREQDLWVVQTENSEGERETIKARMLINAAGPWVDQVIAGAMGKNDAKNVRLVQGSHIVVKKMFDHDRCYIFQNEDGRIIFAIPYENGNFTLIGTTDRDWQDAPDKVEISDSEIDYLCASASEYFSKPVTRDDVVWTYSAVRSLYDDGASQAQAATRDYVLKMDDAHGKTPVMNIFGGKITTYRKLAEAAMEKIGSALEPRGKAWTDSEALPGGGFQPEGFQNEVARLTADFGFLPNGMAARLTRLYGTDARKILKRATSLDDLGRHFGADLYEAEVEYLKDVEWARTAEDILWRRTKLGLRLKKEEAAALNTYLS